MSKFLRTLFGFIRTNPAVLYSLFLIVFLPLALWWHHSFIISSFEKNIDFILQTKALALENMLSEIFVNVSLSYDALQPKVEKVAQDNPEVQKLIIAIPQGDAFRIIAASEKTEISKTVSDPAFSLAWTQEENIASLKGTTKERFWEVVKPIYNEQKEKTALMTMSLSLKNTDLLIARTSQTASLVVLIVIISSLILVMQHTRLFQYLKLYKELQKVDEMKDSFMRLAIHELQAPIANIRGYVEVLIEGLGGSLSAVQKEDLSRVAVSAKSLSELVYDILEVVRIEQAVLDVSLKQTFPQKIVEEIVSAEKVKAQDKGLIFNYSKLETESAVIKINPSRFREILTNLVENAIKYTKSGKVEVKEWLEKKNRYYYVSVEDTGIGISGEEQKRLFEKFYRAQNPETAEIAGTGLGLWITKSLIERMNGAIAVESIKNVGSKFTISFPAAKI